LLLQKGRYVHTLIAWTVALLVAGAVLTLEPRVKGGADDFKTGLMNGKLFNSRRAESELRK
jgi:hypothetical protein